MREVLLVESEIREKFAQCENRNPGPWNTVQRIRNPTKDWNPESRIQIPLTKTGIPVPGIRNRWHGIKNPRLFWIPLHGFSHCFCTVVRMVGGGQRFIVESSN